MAVGAASCVGCVWSPVAMPDCESGKLGIVDSRAGETFAPAFESDEVKSKILGSLIVTVVREAPAGLSSAAILELVQKTAHTVSASEGAQRGARRPGQYLQ